MQSDQKLLLAYDPDMAHPLIKGIEYPYSIRAAFRYWANSGCRPMVAATSHLSDYIRAVNAEKEERLTRYNYC